ncbi:MAG: DUF839 domain-containing protein [Chitinophagales bacterium]|nr:DUF839 domain-containing protein [Chitinophagales bacterium]
MNLLLACWRIVCDKEATVEIKNDLNGKTIYISEDDKPSALYKFISEEKGDYSKGQLYAYRQSDDGESGSWISLPMAEDSLMNITEVALRMGATMFIATEWIEAVGNKLYITESGSDNFNLDREIMLGGKPAKHLVELCRKTGNDFSDPYGRILELDLTNNKIGVVLNGGVSQKDSLFCFSSPDAMTAVEIKGKKYLIISEDTHGGKNGAASAEVVAKNETYNEIYFLDLSIPNPGVDDLMRFMVGPEGCETTGDYFTPDGKSYFLSIQHPSRTNPPPFNKSCTIVVTGKWGL